MKAMSVAMKNKAPDVGIDPAHADRIEWDVLSKAAIVAVRERLTEILGEAFGEG